MAAFSRWSLEELPSFPPQLPCVPAKPKLPTQNMENNLRGKSYQSTEKQCSESSLNFQGTRITTEMPLSNAAIVSRTSTKYTSSHEVSKNWNITKCCTIPSTSVLSSTMRCIGNPTYSNRNQLTANNSAFSESKLSTNNGKHVMDKLRTNEMLLAVSSKIPDSNKCREKNTNISVNSRGSMLIKTISDENPNMSKKIGVPNYLYTDKTSYGRAAQNVSIKTLSSASSSRDFANSGALSLNNNIKTYFVKVPRVRAPTAPPHSITKYSIPNIANTTVKILPKKPAEHSVKTTSEGLPFNDTVSQVNNPALSNGNLLTSSKIQANSTVRRLTRGVCGSSLEDDDTEIEDFLSPSTRWPASQPKSYRGPRREQMIISNRRIPRRHGLRSDTTTTDGETSGMGSSLDELMESSTESASECTNKLYASVQPPTLLNLVSHGGQRQNSPSISLHSPMKADDSLFLLPNSSARVVSSSTSCLFPNRKSGTGGDFKSRPSTSRSPTPHSSSDCTTNSDGVTLFPVAGSCSTQQVKHTTVKRRGGWPKGRKRKPEILGGKPPKAPQTAYVIFMTDRRKHYKDSKPPHGFGPGDVTKLIGAEWSSLTPEQRAPYNILSEQEKRRYRVELQAFRQRHAQLAMNRKKRLKSALSGSNPEDSSDYTDGPEDDAPEELFCSKCDKYFSSLHNKRQHLHGRHHNRGQPVRKSRESPTTTTTDYNTDNNTDYTTDYDDPPSSVHHQHYNFPPPPLSSTTTSPCSSPFPPTFSSPNTSVPATSASEDEDLLPSGGRRERRPSRYSEHRVAGEAIMEEGNDGDQEDGGEEDDGPSHPISSSVVALRAQLADREREIKRLKEQMQHVNEEHAALQQTLQAQLEQQRRAVSSCDAAHEEYVNCCKEVKRLWEVTAGLTQGTVTCEHIMAHTLKDDGPNNDINALPGHVPMQNMNQVKPCNSADILSTNDQSKGFANKRECHHGIPAVPQQMSLNNDLLPLVSNSGSPCSDFHRGARKHKTYLVDHNYATVGNNQTRPVAVVKEGICGHECTLDGSVPETEKNNPLSSNCIDCDARHSATPRNTGNQELSHASNPVSSVYSSSINQICNTKVFPWSNISRAVQEIKNIKNRSRKVNEASTIRDLLHGTNSKALSTCHIKLGSEGILKDNWTAPNKKLFETGIDSDSSTDFLSQRRSNYNPDYTSTDTEDYQSDLRDSDAFSELTFGLLDSSENLTLTSDLLDLELEEPFSSYELSTNKLFDFSDLLTKCLSDGNIVNMTDETDNSKSANCSIGPNQHTALSKSRVIQTGSEAGKHPPSVTSCTALNILHSQSPQDHCMLSDTGSYTPIALSPDHIATASNTASTSLFCLDTLENSFTSTSPSVDTLLSHDRDVEPFAAAIDIASDNIDFL